MRAERLVQILVLLQARGVATAGELAERLGVSVRTIQRDMDVLSVAGIPVYAQRGGRGGWRLDEGYRTSLLGMTAGEALAITVGRPPRLLDSLGLDDASDDALAKLLAALPLGARRDAERARQRILVDLAEWTEGAAPACLPPLQQALWEDRLVRLRYGDRETRLVVGPLGLVAKGVVWYLVGLREAAIRTYRVSRIREVEVTAERFARPAGFDLPEHWRRACADFAATFPDYPVRIRVRGHARHRLHWTAGPQIGRLTELDDGWTEAEVRFENEHEARADLLSLSGDVEVLEPPALRRSLAEAAARIAEANGPAYG